MKPPTEHWHRAQNAVLETAHRKIFRPAEDLYSCVGIAALCYIVAFARFNFFDFSYAGWPPIATIQVVLAGLAMVAFVGLSLLACPIAWLQWRSSRYNEVNSSARNE